MTYDQLKIYNEKLIYAWISGFGSEGPKSDLPAFDVII